MRAFMLAVMMAGAARAGGGPASAAGCDPAELCRGKDAVADCRDAVWLASEGVGAAAAVEAYRAVDWVRVEGRAAVLAGLEREASARPGLEGLAREMRTRLALMEPGTAGLGGADVLEVPVVTAVAVRIGRGGHPAPAVRVAVARAPLVDAWVARAETLRPEVVRDGGGVFADLFGAWARRYGGERVWRDAAGRPVLPDGGAVLGLLRRRLDESMPVLDAAALEEYNRRLEAAAWRRKSLGGGD